MLQVDITNPITSRHRHNKDVVLKIIQDAVIFYRVSDKMEDALRAWAPNRQDVSFEPSHYYQGFYAAFDLMNVPYSEESENSKNEHLGDLGGELFDMAFDKFVHNPSLNAEQAAEVIYKNWIHMIINKTKFQN